MKKSGGRLAILAALACSFLCLAFRLPASGYNPEVAAYYDRQLDSLTSDLRNLRGILLSAEGEIACKKHFLHCRDRYKTIEFFVEQFDQPRQRLLNGPDLTKIEEDNPNDVLRPHGFQRIEAMLYSEDASIKDLVAETDVMIAAAQALRRDPGHEYYFKDAQVWEALRGGIYRVVSLGITGFDVPYCLNALPEAATELRSIEQVTSLYRSRLDNSGWPFANGERCFHKAIALLQQGASFDDFDRMTFIRKGINPLSAWMAMAQKRSGLINRDQLVPLNPYATGIFESDFFDINFFSPNEKYRPDSLRIALGKMLFHDKRLSGTGMRSCASCHQSDKAFTDGLAKPRSLLGDTDLLRNTPTLWYTAYQKKQFFDSRREALEYQLSDVVHNAAEMGGSMAGFVPVVYADTAYRRLFSFAYASDRGQVSQFNIANAISSYMRSLTGFDSRFDKYIRGESKDYTVSEQHGFNLFMGKAKCGTCHYAPVFNGLVPPRYNESESEILAVPEQDSIGAALDADQGKFRFTRVPLHRYAFKTPTVRRCAGTAPYMHNGAFKTLEQVVEFYDRGGGAGYGIRLETQTLPATELHLSETEKRELVSFLRSL